MLSELELIKGCKELNLKAQRELYERYARKMCAVCYSYSGSREDAKDLLHEGFIRVFGKIKDFKAEGSLEGWIRRVMITTTLNHLRKNKRVSIQSINDLDEEHFEDNNSDDDSSFGGFSKEQLALALNSLKEDYRIVFTLYCYDEYSHKEIAEELGILEDTSRTRLRRARAAIRETLMAVRKNSKCG